ncbi:MAG: 4Fe-4S binding protein [Chitinispirillales bacterium]|jgi:ferredoxin|nr:4Fe-4S binding protein [Chitinispirillales bacterium]
MTFVDTDKCDGCGTCVSVCPGNALLINNRLTVSPEKCVSCGVCAKVCPFGAIVLTENAGLTEANRLSGSGLQD